MHLPTVLVALLAACTSVSEPLTPLADLQISPNTQDSAEVANALPTKEAQVEPTEDGQLPEILAGSPNFHSTDPASVTLASGRVQLIEFFAYWCSVCKALAPTVHGLENLYSEQVNFIYLDRDDPETLPLQEQLGYIYQPHFFLLGEDGTVLGQWRGYIEGAVLQQAIVEAIQ